jgi:hypothetical protein
MSRPASDSGSFGSLSAYFGTVRNADCDHVPAPADHAPRLNGSEYGDGHLVVYDDPSGGEWINCGSPWDVRR